VILLNSGLKIVNSPTISTSLGMEGCVNYWPLGQKQNASHDESGWHLFAAQKSDIIRKIFLQ